MIRIQRIVCDSWVLVKFLDVSDLQRKLGSLSASDGRHKELVKRAISPNPINPQTLRLQIPTLQHLPPTLNS